MSDGLTRMASLGMVTFYKVCSEQTGDNTIRYLHVYTHLFFALFLEHGVDGEALVHLDHEALKDLGVRALGKRILILKAIYFLKIQNDIPISSRNYIPQTVDVEPVCFDIFQHMYKKIKEVYYHHSKKRTGLNLCILPFYRM